MKAFTRHHAVFQPVKPTVVVFSQHASAGGNTNKIGLTWKPPIAHWIL